MINVIDTIPEIIYKYPCYKTLRRNVCSKEEYQFVKKCNEYNYLYKNVKYGYYECFGVHELGIVYKAPLTRFKNNNDFIRKR